MSLPVLTANNIKIYNVTGYSHHQLPQWLVRKNSKKLKKDVEWSRRVQLVQDFEFPEASLRIAFTPDLQHIIATGVYKPQFRVYDLTEVALKFERHTTTENVAMQILGDDWRKLALLQADRNIEFHSPLGLYYSTRIPKMGRDMIYDSKTCDLLVGASSGEVYRLNLDRGQFMAPFETAAAAVNCVRQSPLHGLYGFACDNGQVEFWDRRSRNRIGALQISRSADFGAGGDGDTSLEATSVYFLPDGIHWCAGTSDGRVLLFDLRSNQPLDVRDHYNGFAIKKIDYHSASGLILSADKRSVKFWKAGGSSSSLSTGAGPARADHASRLFTAIEADNDINDFALQQNTGLVIVANEGPPISSYYIPALGPAPRWCSFLENITEEMEESPSQGAAVYENFKFVSRPELAQLGLDHLIGSNLLRAYMHGFFVDLRLYEKAKAIANPFAYEEYLSRRKRERLEQERQSRIRAPNTLPHAKVNKRLAIKLANDEQNGAKESTEARQSREDAKKKRSRETASAILKDSRFTDLFNDPDFEIDDESPEFKFHHPVQHK